MPQATWKKSSYSNGQANCVEVCSSLPEIVAVRDSKDRSGPALAFTPDAWRGLLCAIKDGRLSL
jgi:hypothetical protein